MGVGDQRVEHNAGFPPVIRARKVARDTAGCGSGGLVESGDAVGEGFGRGLDGVWGN
jgi:hypothetical protein